MTKLFIPALSVIVLMLSSCTEEVSVSSSYKASPVIYSLLDQSESMHIVKINRGFVGPGNALTFAQIPDSNYFETVSAKVEELVNNIPVRTWNLKDTLINTKSTDGAFFGPQQKVYIFHDDTPDLVQGGASATGPLKENANYRLTVNINEGELQVVGETKIVSGFCSQTSLDNQTAQLKLAKDPGEYLAASLWGNQGSAVFGSVTVEIDIAEIRGTDTTIIRIPWSLGEKTVANGKLTVVGQGETFYSKIKGGITADNTITRRNFMGFNAKFIGGATEFYNYILVNEPSSTLTQTKPIYTNLTVTDGYKVVGLFSARHTFSIYKPFVYQTLAYIRAIDQNSTRELCEGSILAPYLFCSQHPGDIGTSTPKSYACP